MIKELVGKLRPASIGFRERWSKLGKATKRFAVVAGLLVVLLGLDLILEARDADPADGASHNRNDSTSTENADAQIELPLAIPTLASSQSAVRTTSEAPVTVRQAETKSSKTEAVDGETATIPIACSDFVPASIAQDPKKIELLSNLRQSFIAEIGGLNANPNAPDYFDRWEQARRSNDERFYAVFGTELFNEQQALAVNRK
jgi:hypothetical protein